MRVGDWKGLPCGCYYYNDWAGKHIRYDTDCNDRGTKDDRYYGLVCKVDPFEAIVEEIVALQEDADGTITVTSEIDIQTKEDGATDLTVFEKQVSDLFPNVDLMVHHFFENSDIGGGTADEAHLFTVVFPGVAFDVLSQGPFELCIQLKDKLNLEVADPVFEVDEEEGETDSSEDPGDSNRGCDELGNTREEKEWHLTQMHVQDAWEYSNSQNKPSQGYGIVIAQLDAGYDANHMMIQGVMKSKGVRIWHCWKTWRWALCQDEEQGAALPEGDDAQGNLWLNKNHGTMIAAAAAGRGEGTGGLAVRGAAPRAQVYPVRFASRLGVVLGHHALQRLGTAIRHVVEQKKADVISMSVGGLWSTPRLQWAINRAYDENILMVAAASNMGQVLPVVFPARNSHVAAIGGSTREGKPYGQTQGTDRVLKTAAPAFEVCSPQSDATTHSESLTRLSGGTSAATALSGGVAALWLSHHGGRQGMCDEIDCTRDDYKLQDIFMDLIEQTSTPWGDVGSDFLDGPGIINANDLLQAPLNAIPEQGTQWDRSSSSNAKEELSTQNKCPPTTEEMELMGLDMDKVQFLTVDELEEFSHELAWLGQDADKKVSTKLGRVLSERKRNNVQPLKRVLKECKKNRINGYGLRAGIRGGIGAVTF